MNKKLTAKVQKIAPKLPDSTSNISNCSAIKPDDEVTLERKGTVYVTFDVSGRNPLDSLLVTKIVNDVLHDSYYQSESASPIQSLEKAILKLRDNVVNLSKSGEEEDTSLAFNIATAVLWGNTLYLVQYGSTKIFLMRDGKVKPIESATEGKFSVASGVVKDDDVVILATDSFVNKVPPEKLLGSSGFSPETLTALEACLILKLSVVKEFSEDEVVDFGGAAAVAAASERGKGQPEKKDEKRNEQSKTPEPVAEIGKDMVTPKTKRSGRKPKWLFVAGIGLAFFVVFAIGNFFLGEDGRDDIESSEVVTEETNIPKDGEDGEVVIDTSQDDSYKVQRADSNVFYDLKIADETSEASDIAIVGDKIFVADETNGKIYVSELETPKFTAVEGSFAGVGELVNYEGKLGFVDSGGFKAMSNITYNIIEEYTGDGLGVTTTYLEFVYSIFDDTLTKYTKGNISLDGSLWAQNDNFADAVAMGIDTSVYVLKANGELQMYTQGVQDEFEIDGLVGVFSNPVDIVIDVDLESIYVADAGNKRIVVITKEGELVKQYKLTDERMWDDIRGLSVNSDETKAFVLNGSKVYEVDL
jgi:DNA-binding beta-propeller fold protein YncE